MIIKKLEIISFGKFHDKTIEFTEGFNVILGDNESGKTTIINFIYAMFYGFGDNRGKSLSLREKYTPWDGDVCEGKITVFTDDEKNISIYRKAGSAKKYDTVRVFDTDTGEEYHKSPEEIIGIGSDTFFKTLCVRQLSSAFEGNNDEITQKLSNIASGGDEAISYEKAYKILDSARREIQPQRGQGGELSAITNKIADIEKEQLKRSGIKAEINSIDALIPKAEKEVISLKEKYSSCIAKDYTEKIAHLKGRLEEMKKHSSGGNKILFVLGCLILAMALAFLLVNTAIMIVFLFVSATFITAGFLKKSHSKNNNFAKLEEEIQILLREKEVFDKEKEDLAKALYEAERKLENLNIRKESLLISLSENNISPDKLIEIKKKLETKLRTITISTEALRRAHENMQKNFTPSLSKKAAEYFSQISAGKYSKIFCDKELGVMIEKDLPRESSFFSGGTVDQLYLSVRLALIDMIYGDLSCPVLLDQPFLQYDNSRKERTFNLLYNLPKSRQIILFTSDESLNSPNKQTEILT